MDRREFLAASAALAATAGIAQPANPTRSTKIGANVWIQDVDAAVNAVAWSPDGATLYTQDDDRWYTAWNVTTHTGHRLFQFPERCSNHFPRMFTSPDGRFLVTNTSPPLVWDLSAEQLHAEVPSGYHFAGVSVGVGRVRVECVTDDWLGIRTWYFERREPGEELRDWQIPGTIKTHHFSPDGRLVALLNWNDAVTVCDVETRAAVQTIDSPKWALQHCRFAPDGDSLVLYASDGIAVWDVPSASLRAPKVECDRPYWILAFHPTQRVVVVRRKDGVLCLLSLATGEEVRALDFDLGRQVQCAAFSPDGLTCAVGGSKDRFAVFDVDL